MKNPDRLYELLPVVHRLRDAEQGYPLQALLRVIAEQVNVVEDDIAQLYENWFIETCEEWAVPYIGDLVEQQRERILIPRRDVANTIHARRRKGTLALLDELAMDVAGWPARAVEFYKLLGWTQNVHSPYLNRRMYHAARIGGGYRGQRHCGDRRGRGHWPAAYFGAPGSHSASENSRRTFSP